MQKFPPPYGEARTGLPALGRVRMEGGLMGAVAGAYVLELLGSGRRNADEKEQSRRSLSEVHPEMPTKTQLTASAIRAAWTGAQTFLAVVVAAGTDYIHANVWESAAIAAGAAVLSVLKNAIVIPPEVEEQP